MSVTINLNFNRILIILQNSLVYTTLLHEAQEHGGRGVERLRVKSPGGVGKLTSSG